MSASPPIVNRTSVEGSDRVAALAECLIELAEVSDTVSVRSAACDRYVLSDPNLGDRGKFCRVRQSVGRVAVVGDALVGKRGVAGTRRARGQRFGD